MARLFILGAINWVPQWYSDGGARSPDQIPDAFADRVLHGLLRPAARTRRPARPRRR